MGKAGISEGYREFDESHISSNSQKKNPSNALNLGISGVLFFSKWTFYPFRPTGRQSLIGRGTEAQKKHQQLNHCRCFMSCVLNLSLRCFLPASESLMSD